MDDNLDKQPLEEKDSLESGDTSDNELEDILDFTDKKVVPLEQEVAEKEDRGNNILDIKDGLKVDARGKENEELLIKDPLLDSGRRSSSPWLWIGGVILVILLLGATAYFVLSKIGFNQDTINLTFNPQSVDVFIDEEFNKQAVDSLTIKLKSGTHMLKVTKDGYLNLEREFYLSPGEDAVLYVELETIPEIELVLEKNISFAGLANNGKTLVFVDNSGTFRAVSFDLDIDNIKLFWLC